MESGAYLDLLRKGWKWIALFGFIGAALGAVLGFTATPLYRATNTLYFTLEGGSDPDQILKGSTFAQNQVQSFAVLAEKPAVLDPVIEALGLPLTSAELGAQITTTVNLDTVLLDVTASSADPAMAAEIANETAASLTRVVNTLEGGATRNTPGVKASSVATASVPEDPYSPNKRLNVAAGLVLGLAFGTGIVVLRGLLDTKVRDEERVRRITEVPVIGSIPQDPALDGTKPRRSGGPLVSATPVAESFRRLRSSIEYLNFNGAKRVIAITSPQAVDGKSTVAVNVARAFAETSRVLLIDADLRKPTIGAKMGLEESVGLAGVLAHHYTLQAAVQAVPRTGLHVLTAGVIPPNPAELLASAEMHSLIEVCRKEYDWVFIDTPPLLPVSDPTAVGKIVDGLLVVLNVHSTTFQALRSALRILEVTGVGCMGLILNRTARSSGDYYYRRDKSTEHAQRTQPAGPTPQAAPPQHPARRA